MLSKLWDMECICSTSTHRNLLLPSMFYPDAVPIYTMENTTVTYRAKKSGLSEEFLAESPPRNKPVETKNQQFHGWLATQLSNLCRDGVWYYALPICLRAEAQTLNIKHSTDWRPHNSPHQHKTTEKHRREENLSSAGIQLPPLPLHLYCFSFPTTWEEIHVVLQEGD